MPDQRAALERAEQQFSEPKVDIESVRRRSSQRLRNQRITAGVVGIAVFVGAVWIVTSVGSLNRSETSVVPGGDITGPAETGPVETGPTASTAPPTTSEKSLADLPPEGAPPSSPKHGELVVAVTGDSTALGGARTEMYVYADGRLIWWHEGAFPEGDNTLHEQHLTAEGVELLRSEVISSGLIPRSWTSREEHQVGGPATMSNGDPDVPLPFVGNIAVREDDLVWQYFEPPGSFFTEVDVGHTACVSGWGCVHHMTAEQEQTLERLDSRLADPASWLPASAWADQEIKTYMPSAYQFCYGGLYETIEQAHILDALPVSAREPLRGGSPRESLGAIYPTRVTEYCSDVTSEQTYVIVRALAAAGIEVGPGSGPIGRRGTFAYTFSTDWGDAEIRVDPVLPHGGIVCIAC